MQDTQEIAVYQPTYLPGLHLSAYRHFRPPMNPRPTRETLDSLRITLQKLEQTAHPASNGQDIAELKQILLNRMAELEALDVLGPR